MQRAFFTRIAIAAVMGLANPAAAEIVHFTPGTYQLSDEDFGVPIDTLVVTVTGGIANFVLSGVDNATFSVPDASEPTQMVFDEPVYFIPTSGITASWDISTFPYLTFFNTADQGGFTVGVFPTEGDFINLFESNQGTGQLFTVTDAPEPMTLVLFGAGLAGATAFARRRKSAQAA